MKIKQLWKQSELDGVYETTVGGSAVFLHSRKDQGTWFVTSSPLGLKHHNTQCETLEVAQLSALKLVLEILKERVQRYNHSIEVLEHTVVNSEDTDIVRCELCGKWAERITMLQGLNCCGVPFNYCKLCWTPRFKGGDS